jgi:sugar/nucleoside kinase (ribokinase family)
VYLPGDSIDFSHEANFTENLDTVGQAGGYASRGYARLGVTTTFIGYVGEDWMGEQIRSTLQADGIDTRALFIDPRGTSRSVNLVFPDGTRRNFYDGKSHMELHPPMESCIDSMRGARLAHFNIPNWARELLKPAQELGITIATDIQDVIDPHDPYRMDFIRHSDYLFFSAVNHPDPAPVIHFILEINPGAIVVATMGEKGCLLGSEGSVQHYSAVSMDQRVVDSNGAGDAFAVGFLVSRVLENRNLQESVLRGQIAARYKCAQKSTSANGITRELMADYFSHLR